MLSNTLLTTVRANSVVSSFCSCKLDSWISTSHAHSIVQRLEIAVQSLAESKVKTWSQVAGKQLKNYGEQSRLKSFDSVCCSAAAATAPLVSDIKKEKGDQWLLLCMLIYILPAIASAIVVAILRNNLLHLLLSWLTLEAMFFGFRRVEYKKINKILFRNPIPSIHASTSLLERILEIRDDVSPTEFLSGWFLGASVDKIRRGNMREFLAFSFYHRNFGELDLNKQEAVRGHIVRVEEEWQLSFSEGFDSSIDFMAHTREPLRAVHHPLIVYAWAQCVAVITGVVMRFLGFKKHKDLNSCVVYWLREPKSGKATGDPNAVRIFVHGLGIGITPYLGFLNTLLIDGYNGRSLVLELPHIALRLQTKKIPTADDVVVALEAIHKTHNIENAEYWGHSYGSLIIARLIRKSPHLVSSVALLDPVCFLLCLPDVVYNFVYREPKGETSVAVVCDWLRWIFCSREVQVAQVLCRGFDWHELHLWADQIPQKTTVFLSGCDQIVPAKHVKRYLEKNKVSVMYESAFQHAECLFRPSVQKEFVQQATLNHVHVG